MRFCFALSLLLTAASAAAWAQAEEAPPASNPAVSQKARELIEVVSPASELQQQFVTSFMASFAQLLDGDEQFVSLEKRSPGIGNAIKSAVLPELTRRVPAYVAHMNETAAALYTQALSDKDMDAAIAFFQSPAGMRMAAKMKAGGLEKVQDLSSSGKLRQDMGAGLESAVDSAAASGLQDLSEADSAAIVEFSKNPASYKLAMVRGQIISLMASEVKSMSENVAADLAPMITVAIKQHLKSH